MDLVKQIAPILNNDIFFSYDTEHCHYVTHTTKLPPHSGISGRVRTSKRAVCGVEESGGHMRWLELANSAFGRGPSVERALARLV